MVLALQARVVLHVGSPGCGAELKAPSGGAEKAPPTLQGSLHHLLLGLGSL